MNFSKNFQVEKRLPFNNYEKFLKFEVVDTTIKENEIRNFYDKKKILSLYFQKIFFLKVK